jgi:hypothetical protein
VDQPDLPRGHELGARYDPGAKATNRKERARVNAQTFVDDEGFFVIMPPVDPRNFIPFDDPLAELVAQCLRRPFSGFELLTVHGNTTRVARPSDLILDEDRKRIQVLEPGGWEFEIKISDLYGHRSVSIGGGSARFPG